MNWCHLATSHFLNQCWLIIREVFRHSPESNFIGNAQISFLWVSKWLQPHLQAGNELKYFSPQHFLHTISFDAVSTQRISSNCFYFQQKHPGFSSKMPAIPGGNLIPAPLFDKKMGYNSIIHGPLTLQWDCGYTSQHEEDIPWYTFPRHRLFAGRDPFNTLRMKNIGHLLCWQNPKDNFLVWTLLYSESNCTEVCS